jgi:hypothetical protein
MSTISRDIHVDASPQVVRDAWTPFVETMLSGPMRLACDELACTDAVRSGLLTIAPAAEGEASVVVQLECADGQGPADATVAQRLMRDLILFKDFVETGDGVSRKSRTAWAEEQARREGKPNLEPKRADDDVAHFSRHFPN